MYCTVCTTIQTPEIWVLTVCTFLSEIESVVKWPVRLRSWFRIMRFQRTLTEALTFLCSRITHMNRLTQTNKVASVRVHQTNHSRHIGNTVQRAITRKYWTSQDVIMYQNFSWWTSTLINKLKTAVQVNACFYIRVAMWAAQELSVL